MSLDRVAVPMAFIGGPLNLQPLPAELLGRTRFEALIPKSSLRAEYVNSKWRLPHRENEDFIFFVDAGSTSLDEAAAIIKANFFK